MNNDEYYQSTHGVYKTEYADTGITVRVYECPELLKPELINGKWTQGRAVWVAQITYTDPAGEVRTELDTITPEKLKHCRDQAVAEMDAAGLEPWGELHKAYIAKNYWQLIK